MLTVRHTRHANSFTLCKATFARPNVPKTLGLMSSKKWHNNNIQMTPSCVYVLVFRNPLLCYVLKNHMLCRVFQSSYLFLGPEVLLQRCLKAVLLLMCRFQSGLDFVHPAPKHSDDMACHNTHGEKTVVQVRPICKLLGNSKPVRKGFVVWTTIILQLIFLELLFEGVRYTGGLNVVAQVAMSNSQVS